MGDQVLSEAQVAEFQEAFCLLDRDGDGCITIEELENAIKWLVHNPTKGEVQSMMAEVGQGDGKRSIEFGLFLSIMARELKGAEAEDELREAFRVFDKDQDGLISPSELRSGMMKIGVKLRDGEMEGMIRVADLDGDGRVSYHEFVRMMLAL